MESNHQKTGFSIIACNKWNHPLQHQKKFKEKMQSSTIVSQCMQPPEQPQGNQDKSRAFQWRYTDNTGMIQENPTGKSCSLFHYGYQSPLQVTQHLLPPPGLTNVSLEQRRTNKLEMNSIISYPQTIEPMYMHQKIL